MTTPSDDPQPRQPPSTLQPNGTFRADSAADPVWADFERDLGRAAGSDVTILLNGESGSGKSRAAQRIHDLSPRAGEAFVPVHLAGLSASLIDAELFGHEEGAFTGAAGARMGRFVRASGGTLVLEGIEVLSSDLQVKLLRVLQERVVEPLGSQAPVPVDIRIIATSALDLATEVQAGRFREDLYFRLAVVILRVPALRQRATALPGLAREVSIEVAQRLGVAPRPLSEAALECLAGHPWPGNLRELENALERVLVLGAELGSPQPIQATEFSFLGDALDGAAQDLARRAMAQGLGVDDLLDALLVEALREERGNASAAARRLGLTRRAFEYRRSRVEGQRTGDDSQDA